MARTVPRTPGFSLEDAFLRAAASLGYEDVRAGVVAAALGHLQRGFDAHYAGGPGRVTDDGYRRHAEASAELSSSSSASPCTAEVKAASKADGAR